MSNQPNKPNGTKPAVRKKKNLLDDRRIRLALSVLGAIVAWMVVTIIVQPGTTNTIYNVPVDYTYDSSVYTMLSEPSMVTVTPLSMPLAPRTSRRRVFSPLSRTLDQSG